MTPLKKGVTKHCEHCGKEFYTRQSRCETKRWCSNECYLADRRIKKVCPFCGKEFYSPKKRQRAYCSAECRKQAKPKPWNMRGEKGDRFLSRHGYIYIHVPDHPSVRHKEDKRVYEHRLVMEKHLGRFLEPSELVRHKNRIRSDNRIENLELRNYKNTPNSSGYSWVYSPDHPIVQGKQYKSITEHRMVMEKHLGRFLEPSELVRHKNRIRSDNRIEDLELRNYKNTPNSSGYSWVYSPDHPIVTGKQIGRAHV